MRPWRSTRTEPRAQATRRATRRAPTKTLRAGGLELVLRVERDEFTQAGDANAAELELELQRLGSLHASHRPALLHRGARAPRPGAASARPPPGQATLDHSADELGLTIRLHTGNGIPPRRLPRRQHHRPTELREHRHRPSIHPAITRPAATNPRRVPRSAAPTTNATRRGPARTRPARPVPRGNHRVLGDMSRDASLNIADRLGDPPGEHAQAATRSAPRSARSRLSGAPRGQSTSPAPGWSSFNPAHVGPVFGWSTLNPAQMVHFSSGLDSQPHPAAVGASRDGVRPLTATLLLRDAATGLGPTRRTGADERQKRSRRPSTLPFTDGQAPARVRMVNGC